MAPRRLPAALYDLPMRPRPSPFVIVAGIVGLLLLVVGVVYLTVECQALPGFLGPTHGDRSPRTGLGIASFVLGLGAFAVAVASFRRRRPAPPLYPQ